MSSLAILSLATCIASIGCGASVYYGERGTAASRAFGLACLCTAVTAFAEFMIRQAEMTCDRCWVLTAQVWPLALAATVHFGGAYSRMRFAARRASLGVIYAAAALLFILGAWTALRQPAAGYWWAGAPRVYRGNTILTLGYLWTGLTVAALGVLLIWRATRAEAGRARRQAIAIMTALTLPLCVSLATVAAAVAPGAGTPWPDLSAISMGLALVAVTVALKRYRVYTLSSAEAARSLLATMADAVFLLDDSGRIVTVNPAALRMLARPQEAVVGRHLSEFIRDADRDLGFLAPGTTGMLGAQRDVELLGANATALPVSIAASTIRDERRRPAGLVCVARDISERKRNEEVLRNAAEKLQRSHRELQGFLFAASHHLQEPLRKVRTLSSRLSLECGRTGSVRAQDYLERIDRNTGRMQALLESLRTYLAIQADPSRWTTFDLTTLLREVVLGRYDRIAAIGATVNIHDLPLVRADRMQIGTLFDQLVLNALQNARPQVPLVLEIYGRRASEGPPGADASAAQWPRECEIRIDDNGNGFDDRYRERIFGVFQRLASAGGRDEGAGIGLSVCRKIVEVHGGTIAARGRLGEGATFIVKMPIEMPRSP